MAVEGNIGMSAIKPVGWDISGFCFRVAPATDQDGRGREYRDVGHQAGWLGQERL